MSSTSVMKAFPFRLMCSCDFNLMHCIFVTRNTVLHVKSLFPFSMLFQNFKLKS